MGDAAREPTPRATGPVGHRRAVRERTSDVERGFSSVMLVMNRGSGEDARMFARPMNVASIGEDCTITFMVRLDASQADEATRNPVAMVIAQGSARFASISGRVEVVRDRARLRAAWAPSYEAHLPDGENDPRLCLIVFRPDAVEVWDRPATTGRKVLFDVVRALVTDTTTRRDADAPERPTPGAG